MSKAPTSGRRSQASRKPPFQPDLLQGREREDVCREFLEDAQRWRLLYRCDDCTFVCLDGACSLGWPNRELRAEPFEVVDQAGIAQFCKAFEPADG